MRGTAVPRGGVTAGVAGPRPAWGNARYGYWGGGFYHFYRPYYAFRPRFSLGFGLWVGAPIAYPWYGYYGYPYYDAYPYYGYPYAYPYSYPYGYSYPDPNAYPNGAYPNGAYPNGAYPNGDPNAPYGANGAPPAGSVGVQPGAPGAPGAAGAPGQTNNSGGLSFEITPDTAQVFVDGQYVGTVATFSPTSQPLTLDPGRHHVQIRAQGYQSMEFDADITAGMVIPYRGTMQAGGNQ